MLEIGTGIIILLFGALGATGHVEFALVTEVCSIGVALNACGSGASRVSGYHVYPIIIQFRSRSSSGITLDMRPAHFSLARPWTTL